MKMFKSIILAAILLIGLSSASNVLSFGRRDAEWKDRPIFLETFTTDLTATEQPHTFKYEWTAPGIARYSEVQVYVDGWEAGVVKEGTGLYSNRQFIFEIENPSTTQLTVTFLVFGFPDFEI